MRLLEAASLHFEDFFDNNIPKYAILSHRWTNNEPSYHDMKAAMAQVDVGRSTALQRKGKGYSKIYDFSLQALKAGYKWIWVDTVCIDKSSSADLQEAINSMYRWYQESEICYAYLSDVSIPARNHEDRHDHPASQHWIQSFRLSEWFKRGWTLQELLGPRELIFFDRDWNQCGTRSELQEAIQAATGIDAKTIVQASIGESNSLWSVRAGRRMAWAANRQTTKPEDRAYSLMGLFDVYMPLLYGEGERAFHRLQEEIIKVDEDASLLAWSCVETDTGFAPNGLARSPNNFRNYLALFSDRILVPFVPFSPRLAARGLQATLHVQRDPFEKALAYAVLLHKNHGRSLVLPIMFTTLTFARSPVANECVRFSNPVWVRSSFVEKAEPKPICFIREVRAARTYHAGDGLSLSSAVWRNYVTMFTYPTQTQPQRRHFPAIPGRFWSARKRMRKVYTFIIELAARKDPAQRFIILVSYQLYGQNITRENGLAITVIKSRRPIGLWSVEGLIQRNNARRNDARRDVTSHDLLDEDGNVIPRNDILHIHRFTSFWVNERDNDLDQVPRCLSQAPETKSICMITRVYGDGGQ